MFAFAVRVWIQVYLVDPNTMWVAGWCIQALVKVITPLVAAEYFIASLPRLTVHFSHCTTNHSRGRGGILVRRSLIRSHLSRVVSPDLPKRLHVFYLRSGGWWRWEMSTNVALFILHLPRWGRRGGGGKDRCVEDGWWSYFCLRFKKRIRETEGTFWPSPAEERSREPPCPSDDSVVPERLEQHRVLDVAEDPADVVGVGGAGEVRIQSLPLVPVVAVDGLLLVHLADVVHGVLGVLPVPCKQAREGQ